MKNVKDFIAAILYRLLALVVKLLPAKKGLNHLLIVKPDEIGDYIIFRNLLQTIRQSGRFKDHTITLILTESYKSIYERYDAPYANNVIWVNKKKFNRDLGYRFSLLKQVRMLRTSTVLNFIFSRTLTLDDGFALVATGTEKLAMNADNSNQGPYSWNIDRLIYSQIIPSGGVAVFDSVRNAQFLSAILKEDVTVDTKFSPCAPRNAKGVFGIFLGAGNPERNWPVAHFVAVAAHMWQQHGLGVYVFGGPPDAQAAEIFMTTYKGHAVNYAGKTSLTQYIDLLNEIKFLICVDTGPLHIAIANCCPVFGLFSGKYYKRYAPYPAEITATLFPIYPNFIDTLIATNNPVLYNPFQTKNDTIHLIPAEKVIARIEKEMSAGNV